MTRDVVLEAAESVPPTATVRDYDELPHRTRERLPDLVDGDATAADLTPGEYVKYTRYYRVSSR